jgi:hypothetical protein
MLPISPVGCARTSPTASTTLVPSTAEGSQPLSVEDLPFCPIINPLSFSPSASCSMDTALM